MPPGERWRLLRGDQPASGPDLPTVAALVDKVLPAGTEILEQAKSNASRLQGAQQAHKQALDQRLHGSHFERNGGSALLAFLIALGSGLLAFAAAGGSGLPAIIII